MILNARVHFFLTCSLAFLLPIWPKIVPPVIIVLVLNWLIGGKFKTLFRWNEKTPWLLLFISFYLLCLAGILWSDNLEYAFKDMEIKLALLVLPVVYFSSVTFDRQQGATILKAFILGCLVAALVCFFYALYRYLSTKYLISQGRGLYDYGVYNFLKERLSVWIHPSYRSMYFVLALAVIFLMKDTFKKRLLYLIVPVLAGSVLLYSSRAAIISLFLLGLYVAFVFVYREKKYLQALVGIVLSVSLLFALYRFVPQVAERVDETIQTLTTDTDVNTSQGSTASRVAVWKASAALVSEHWLVGTGTGDVKDALLEKYRQEGMTHALEEKMNAHNQFLQAFIALGLPGFMLLLASFLLPMITAARKKQKIFLTFLLLMVFNSVFESMFETQAGVVYYAFFNSLFMFSFEE